MALMERHPTVYRIQWTWLRVLLCQLPWSLMTLRWRVATRRRGRPQPRCSNPRTQLGSRYVTFEWILLPLCLWDTFSHGSYWDYSSDSDKILELLAAPRKLPCVVSLGQQPIPLCLCAWMEDSLRKYYLALVLSAGVSWPLADGLHHWVTAAPFECREFK